MKKIVFFILLLGSYHGFGQLSVNILTPPGGIMDKQQLWNIIATNTESYALSVQVQVTFAEAASGQPVFTASVPSLLISPGTTQITPGSIGTPLFNIANPDYQMDPGPNGLLPVGTFNVCYTFLIDKYNKVVRECQTITIPPLGPLLLIQPANSSETESIHPLFSWLPFSSGKSLNHLRYDFRIVEMQEGQTAADAIKDNLPLYTTVSLLSPSYSYNNTAGLEAGKNYAWQVIAVNNMTPITKSEAWSFHVKEQATQHLLPPADPVFIKLKKAGIQEGDAVFVGNLRFDFFNEASAGNWRILVEDISSAGTVSFALPMDSIKIKRGQNLVSYDAVADRRFEDRHLYLLKMINAHNEIWQLRFEYRKPARRKE